MPYKNKNGELCGFVDWLDSSNFKDMVKRYLMIKSEKNRLELYTDYPDYPGTECVKKIDFKHISLVMRCNVESSSTNFYITINNNNMYLAAENQQDRDDWCDSIQPFLPKKVSFPDLEKYSDFNTNVLPQLGDRRASSEYKRNFSSPVNAMDYLVASTFHLYDRIDSYSDGANSSDNSPDLRRKAIDFYNSNIIKSGYCNKRSGNKKNIWQRRYFILSIDGLSYLRSHLDKYRKGFMKYEDIIICRHSIGINHTRKNVFEIVTNQKVYYCQTENVLESEGWIKDINDNNKFTKKNRKKSYKLQHQQSQDDSGGIHY